MKISRRATIKFVLLATLSLGAEARLGKATGGSNANNKRVLQLVELEGFGGDPSDNDLPLGLCQGDCDDDTDVSHSGIQNAGKIFLAYDCSHVQRFYFPYQTLLVVQHY